MVWYKRRNLNTWIKVFNVFHKLSTPTVHISSKNVEASPQNKRLIHHKADAYPSIILRVYKC